MNNKFSIILQGCGHPWRVILFLFLFFLIGCGDRGSRFSRQPGPGEDYRPFTSNGAWCWFSDPRAVFFEGKFRRIYAGWVDTHGNITVGYYDIDSDSLKQKIIHEDFETDDHDAPSLYITREGRIMVFYSRHATPAPIYLTVSENPEEIESWESRHELYLNDTTAYDGYLNSYTYTNVCRLSDEKNKFYIFWRGMDFKPNFATSSDGGKSWTKGKILILPDRIYKNRRPYIKVASDNNDRIDFAFTDGHPRNEASNSIYYIQYRAGAFYRADGKKVADMNELPLHPDQADKVYDASSTGEKAWIWDVAEDRKGKPVIVYVRFQGDTSHIYYYAKWDYGSWNNHILVKSGGWFPQTPPGTEEREPDYSGGLVLDHEDPSIVYASVKRNNKFEIEKWATPDGGLTWIVDPVTINSKNDNVRPVVIRNVSGKDSPNVLWMNIEKYVHYTDFKSSIRMDIR